MRRMAMMAALLAGLQTASAASGCAMRDEAKGAVTLAGPTILEAGRTVVPVRLERGLAASDRPRLVIEGLRFDAPPGVLYEVYLQGRGGRRALVGVINFYNQGAGGYGATTEPSAAATTQSFDAAAALRALGGAPSALVFEPSTGVTGPGVKAAANPAARVRFSSATIELH